MNDIEFLKKTISHQMLPITVKENETHGTYFSFSNGVVWKKEGQWVYTPKDAAKETPHQNLLKAIAAALTSLNLKGDLELLRSEYAKAMQGKKEGNSAPRPPIKNTAQTQKSNQNQPQQNQSSSLSDDDIRNLQVKVFGGKGALTIIASETASGFPTITIEAAKKIGEKQYDWNNKIAVQITKQELPELVCVFLGIMKNTKGQHHGPAKDKWFDIEFQEKNLFVKLGKGKDMIAVPVPKADTVYLAQIGLSRLANQFGNFTNQSATDIMTILRYVFR